MLVAIKKFKESDDNEYVSICIGRHKTHFIFIRLFKYKFGIGEENCLERDKDFEAVET